MGSASGGNKTPCKKWKYFVRNFSSLGGAESNNLKKGVREFIQERRVMKEHRNLES